MFKKIVISVCGIIFTVNMADLYAAENKPVCSMEAEAQVCEGAVSYFDNAGVHGLAEEVKSLADSLVNNGCENECSLALTTKVLYGKHANGKAWATVQMNGAE